jgi:hypothetical protein
MEKIAPDSGYLSDLIQFNLPVAVDGEAPGCLNPGITDTTGQGPHHLEIFPPRAILPTPTTGLN